MNYTSVGDQSLTFRTRRFNVQLKTDLSRLAQELASGKKTDLASKTSGDFAPVIDLERSLKANLAYATATTEAALFAASMQTSLELVQNKSSELGPTLLSASSAANPMSIQVSTADAKSKFETVLAAFNTQVAGRYAFSGASTDRPALADADTILLALQPTVATATTATGVQAAVDAWFDTPGGGFETIGYTGSFNQMAPFSLSDTEFAQLGISAENQEIRDVLKGFVLASLVGTGTLSGDDTQRAALARLAGEQVMSAEYSLSVVRANVGSGEAKIDNSAARNISEKSALEIARNELTAIDPYESATELEALKSQLETLYTLTVRMSRLSLAEYLR